MKVNQLGEKEKALLVQINSVEGTMEEKSRQLRDNGIFDAYQHIHTQYAALALRDSEALKRGLFLQWYSQVEPSCYTGLGELDSRAERILIEVLNDKLSQDQVDAELGYMVSYYAGWEWVFETYKGYNSLDRLLANRTVYDLIIETLKCSNLTDRGQMGVYWKSIIEAD